MSRPPTIPAERKFRIVLTAMQGEISVAEATRREKVSEKAIGNWKRQFLEGGKAGIEAGVEIRVWKKSAEGHLNPLRTSG